MRNQLRSLSAAGTVGLDIAVSVVLGLLVGSWLDRKYGWAPWGVIVGLVVGTATGFNMLFKTAKKMERQAQREQRQQDERQSGWQREKKNAQGNEHDGLASMTHTDACIDAHADAHADTWAAVNEDRESLKSEPIFYRNEPNDNDAIDPIAHRSSGDSSDDTHDAAI